MNLRKRIASWLLFALPLGPTALAQTGPPTGRALLIADIHLDPLADPAIVRQLIHSPVAQWEVIFQSSRQKSFSPYGSDTNYWLLSSTLAEVAAQAPYDYAIFTGDALRHTFLQAFVTAGGKPAEFPEFAAKTEAFVVQQLQNRLHVPVMAALGNNDSSCADYQNPPHGPFLASLANQLTVLSTFPGAKATFQVGGFYSVPHPTVPNQDIIVLNTVFWSTFYKSCIPNSGDPGEAEMRWLRRKLSTARSLHRGVTLVMHIPPGMNAYNSSHGQCLQPVSFWQAKYSTEFATLMSTYSGVVHLAFGAHIHMDDFRVSVAGPPSLPLRLTPAVSPIFKNNPAFSAVTYDLTTASVSDIKTYFLALSSQTPSWSKEYQFSSAYHIDSFSAANLSALATAITNGGGARATFENNYAASTPSPINSSNFPFYSCAHTHFTPAGYRDCTCGAASSVPPEQAPR